MNAQIEAKLLTILYFYLLLFVICGQYSAFFKVPI